MSLPDVLPYSIDPSGWIYLEVRPEMVKYARETRAKLDKTLGKGNEMHDENSDFRWIGIVAEAYFKLILDYHKLTYEWVRLDSKIEWDFWVGEQRAKVDVKCKLTHFRPNPDKWEISANAYQIENHKETEYYIFSTFQNHKKTGQNRLWFHGGIHADLFRAFATKEEKGDIRAINKTVVKSSQYVVMQDQIIPWCIWSKYHMHLTPRAPSDDG